MMFLAKSMPKGGRGPFLLYKPSLLYVQKNGSYVNGDTYNGTRKRIPNYNAIGTECHNKIKYKLNQLDGRKIIIKYNE